MGKVELTVQIDAELVQRAKAAGIDVTEFATAALRLELERLDRGMRESGPKELDRSTPESRTAQWAEENGEAIEAYNERIQRRGVFGADLRRW